MIIPAQSRNWWTVSAYAAQCEPKAAKPPTSAFANPPLPLRMRLKTTTELRNGRISGRRKRDAARCEEIRPQPITVRRGRNVTSGRARSVRWNSPTRWSLYAIVNFGGPNLRSPGTTWTSGSPSPMPPNILATWNAYYNHHQAFRNVVAKKSLNISARRSRLHGRTTR